VTKLKRTVAREWLILLIFLLPSPEIMATYLWVTEPGVEGPDRDPNTIKGALDSVGFYNRHIPPGPILYVYEETSRKPPARKPAPGILIDNMGLLKWYIVKKRPFWDYFLHYMRFPSAWVRWGAWWPFVVAYLSYLFIRSVVWSIRTMRSRET